MLSADHPPKQQARMKQTVFDHVAIGTRTLSEGWQLFGGLLGGGVADLGATLAAVRVHGIEPVGVDVSNADWKEAFLHPRDAHGIVIQLAEQHGAPELPRPADLPDPGPSSACELVEHQVTDLPGYQTLHRAVRR